MSPDFGRAALALALALTLAQIPLAFAGARAPALLNAARRSAFVSAVAVGAAFLTLVAAFVGSDFSVANVAANSHTDKPLLYKIAAAWGSHEGSMLLWCLVMTGYAAAFAGRSASEHGALGARALGVLAILSSAFLAFTLFASNPFARLLEAPLQGRGFNPLLQDPALAAHPPALYMGYVGLAVPFAIAVGALWTGESKGWARSARRWTLGAFAFLTIGIALGAYWAYYELGWGGWWFWDPVENASFMPWLMAAALLHSALATERTGALGGWTALLAILAFGLSIFGTFLTRSGVLTSVHSFAVDPARGVVLLVMLAAALGGALLLYAFRANKLGGAPAFAIESRETLILANNVFLVAAAAVVWIGTSWPLFLELAGGGRVSVGAPYFEIAALPILGLVVAVMPFGPLVAWRRGDFAAAARRLWLAAILGAMALAVFFALSRGGAFLPALTAGLGVWAIAGAGVDLFARAGWPGRGFVAGLRALGLSARALAAPLAHAGVGVFAVAAATETAFHTEHQAVIGVGERMQAGDREVVFETIGRADGPNYAADRARMAVVRDDRVVARLEPERRFYPVGEHSTTEVAISSTPAGDLYIALGPPQAGEGDAPRWAVRVLYNPLIGFVFFGPLLIALGGAAALITRRKRELAATTSGAAAEPAE